MAIVYNKLAPTDGLVLCLDSANRRSYPGTGNTWFDLSGNGNNGTLTNGASLNTGSGGGINFDGVDDRVAIGTYDIFGSTQLAISAWIKPTTLSGNDKSIVAQTDSLGTTGRAFRQDGNQLQWAVANPSNYRVWRSNSALKTDWQHVIVIANGISIPLMYRNGVSLSVTLALSLGAPILPSAQPLSIGYDGGYIQTLYNFNGQLDDIRIYNRALTNEEILTLYNVSRRRFL